MARRRAPALLAIAGTATAAFASAAAASATRASAHVDRALEPRIALRRRSRAGRLADAASPLGKWYTLGSAAVAVGTWLELREKRRAAGAAVALSGIAAAGLSFAFDKLLPQPPLPAGHRDQPRKPTFPSGHAFVSTATCCTAAYILAREGLIAPRAAAPIAAVLPIVNTGLKLGVRKHWVSDAVGGVAGGIAVAAACCAAYELTTD